MPGEYAPTRYRDRRGRVACRRLRSVHRIARQPMASAGSFDVIVVGRGDRRFDRSRACWRDPASACWSIEKEPRLPGSGTRRRDPSMGPGRRPPAGPWRRAATGRLPSNIEVLQWYEDHRPQASTSTRRTPSAGCPRWAFRTRDSRTLRRVGRRARCHGRPSRQGRRCLGCRHPPPSAFSDDGHQRDYTARLIVGADGQPVGDSRVVRIGEPGRPGAQPVRRGPRLRRAIG